MSVGRKVTILEDNLILVPSPGRGRAGFFDLPLLEGESPFSDTDPIRLGSGDLWTINNVFEANSEFVFGSGASYYDSEIINSYDGVDASSDVRTGILFTVDWQNTVEVNTDVLFPTIQQKMTLKPRLDSEFYLVEEVRPGGGTGTFYRFREDVWDGVRQTFVFSPLGISYKDCPFKYNAPYPFETGDTTIDNIRTLVSEVKPTYNFSNKKYEDVINTGELVPEFMLPCLYSFLSERHSDYLDSPRSIYNEHISLMGRIQGVYTNITNESGEKIGEKDTGFTDYFNVWTGAMKEIDLESSTKDYLRQHFTNVIFSHEDIDFLNQFDRKKHMFPMYMEINFSTGETTQVADLLGETQLMTKLIDYVRLGVRYTGTEFYNPPGAPAVRVVRFQDVPEYSFEKQEMTGDVVIGTNQVINYSSKIWDLENWIDVLELTLDEWEDSTIDESDFSSIFGRNKGDYFSHERLMNGNSLTANLMKILFIGHLRDMVFDYNRTPEEIFEGEMTHSEVIFYEIEKFVEESSEPIQRFFIPNSSKLGVCNFIDTQVKYNKNYNYKIHAYQLIFGTSYDYLRDESDRFSSYSLPSSISGRDVVGEAGSEGDTVTTIPNIVVSAKPYLKLVRVPYYETGFKKIMDKPPIAPDVNIIPYKGRTDRLLFFLNANIGRYKKVPEKISSDEAEQIVSLKASQQNDPYDLIEYNSDDPPSEFQAYRRLARPKKYEDFDGHRIRTISTHLPGVNAHEGMNTMAASFEDFIRPNTKYYYTFRTIDVHGHFSYPSPIYEVEMVEADGAIYLIIGIVELNPEVPKASSKKMRGEVLITPSLPHRILNMQEIRERAVESDIVIDALRGVLEVDPATGEPSLPTLVAGQLNNSHIVMGGPDIGEVWNKKYKFRFVSRNTGRKIDLNVKFTHKHLSIEEDVPE